ncbi:MAG TPA: periplasmic heavy metal sensor [Vicinamibacterales bacterium]|nr:periplasmic heavy metal sensor [Vicinamibacterales bacterium]
MPAHSPRPLAGRGSWLAVLLVLASAVPALGGQKAKWWRSETYQRELRLTSDQVTRLDRIFHESWPDLKRHKQDLDRLEAELSKLIAESTDEARVVEMIDQVEAARSALGRTRSLMLYRMHRVLSPSQRATLKALHDAADSRHHKGPDSSR